MRIVRLCIPFDTVLEHSKDRFVEDLRPDVLSNVESGAVCHDYVL